MSLLKFCALAAGGLIAGQFLVLGLWLWLQKVRRNKKPISEGFSGFVDLVFAGFSLLLMSDLLLLVGLWVFSGWLTSGADQPLLWLLVAGSVGIAVVFHVQNWQQC